MICKIYFFKIGGHLETCRAESRGFTDIIAEMEIILDKVIPRKENSLDDFVRTLTAVDDVARVCVFEDESAGLSATKPALKKASLKRSRVEGPDKRVIFSSSEEIKDSSGIKSPRNTMPSFTKWPLERKRDFAYLCNSGLFSNLEIAKKMHKKYPDLFRKGYRSLSATVGKYKFINKKLIKSLKSCNECAMQFSKDGILSECEYVINRQFRKWSFEKKQDFAYLLDCKKYTDEEIGKKMNERYPELFRGSAVKIRRSVRHIKSFHKEFLEKLGSCKEREAQFFPSKK